MPELGLRSNTEFTFRGSTALICVTEPSTSAAPVRTPDTDVTPGTAASCCSASTGMRPSPKPPDRTT